MYTQVMINEQFADINDIIDEPLLNVWKKYKNIRIWLQIQRNLRTVEV